MSLHIFERPLEIVRRLHRFQLTTLGPKPVGFVCVDVQSPRCRRLESTNGRTNFRLPEFCEEMNVLTANRRNGWDKAHCRDLGDDCFANNLLINWLKDDRWAFETALRVFVATTIGIGIIGWFARLSISLDGRNVFSSAPRPETARVSRQPGSIGRPCDEPPFPHTRVRWGDREAVGLGVDRQLDGWRFL
jgi:hypothetical protein